MAFHVMLPQWQDPLMFIGESAPFLNWRSFIMA